MIVQRHNGREPDIPSLTWIIVVRIPTSRFDSSLDNCLELKLVGVLRNTFTIFLAVRVVVKHDDPQVATITPVVCRRFVNQWVLKHSIELLAIWRHRQCR